MFCFQVAPICQRGGLSAGTTTTTTTTTSRPDCPYGWEAYEDSNGNLKCFKYCGDTTYPTYAEESCRAQGGHLASIHSAEEQNFLVQTFNPSSEVWIGAVDPHHNSGWEWTDGTPFDFSYWGSGEPDGGQYYTTMTTSSGRWSDHTYDHYCQYICQLSL